MESTNTFPLCYSEFAFGLMFTLVKQLSLVSWPVPSCPPLPLGAAAGLRRSTSPHSPAVPSHLLCDRDASLGLGLNATAATACRAGPASGCATRGARPGSLPLPRFPRPRSTSSAGRPVAAEEGRANNPNLRASSHRLPMFLQGENASSGPHPSSPVRCVAISPARFKPPFPIATAPLSLLY
ncbi:hypothetical protein LY76DRAFT_275734 [Colletotrichum caudatum]|nr:hypothetical protein LY76DRAFT_275734 [Colletotrichum caudatum]